MNSTEMSGQENRTSDPTEWNKPHVTLAKFRVLYIGRAAPKAAMDSLDAIQKPLCELYTKDDCQSRNTDVDAVLTVLTSGLFMEPVNALDKDLWLPIQNLQSCAAVKAVVTPRQYSEGELSFVPVDSPSAAGSQYPAVFSCVMGRSNGLPLTDCFAFVCQSNDDAMLTVQAAMYAFGNKCGWATDRPSKAALAVTSECRQGDVDTDDTPFEFYEKPPLSGFFYTPSPGLIQKYNIQGEACPIQTRSYSDLRTPYIPEQPELPLPVAAAPQPPNPPVNPMIFFDTEQDMVYVDQPVRIQYPTISGPRVAAPPEVSFVRDMGPSQSIAFNPYLVPSLDPPIPVPVQAPMVIAPIARAATTYIPNDPVIIPVVQERFAHAPRSDLAGDPVYQKRLPRSNIGVQQTYNNQDSSRPGRFEGITSGYGAAERPPVGGTSQQNPFALSRQPVEELYSQRLPPQGPEPLPSGAMLFDPNFILRQSDTDKRRIADVENHEGYPTPRPINIADFGY